MLNTDKITNYIRIFSVSITEQSTGAEITYLYNAGDLKAIYVTNSQFQSEWDKHAGLVECVSYANFAINFFFISLATHTEYNA